MEAKLKTHNNIEAYAKEDKDIMCLSYLAEDGQPSHFTKYSTTP